MTYKPGDVSDTLEDRYTTVKRRELPDNFESDPLGTMDAINETYRQAVGDVDPDAAQEYHDWSVRVELDPESSRPVTSTTVAKLNKWVSLHGVVSRIKQPKPREIMVAWACKSCDMVTELPPSAGRPKACSCKGTYFEKDKAQSMFVDSQEITVSEHFEDIRGSRPPRMLNCRLDGTMVLKLSPGDRCVVGGVLDLVESAKAGYDYVLHVNNAAPYRPAKQVEPPTIRGDVMDTLVRSFAPRTYGHHTIKESIILMLAGGVDDGADRHNINILLVGDPGIAKSALLKEAAATAPLGQYTSGRGSTAAGLTAGMARDRDGLMYMEAGAAVLTDGGLLSLDEFDKMRDTDRAAMHEVMEQQTVSMTKLGVRVTMNARVSVLAAANPKDGVWNDGLALAENIDLPESMITRFDLIYNLRDVPDAETDALIAKHIVKRRAGRPQAAEPESDDAPQVLSREEITAYMDLVRPLKPVITVEAQEAIVKYYVGSRSEDGEIRVTPRQLEAVVRLAGARAKVYRQKDITIKDATRAIYLVENMIQRTMLDPATGKPDQLKATTGKSKAGLRLVDEITATMNGEFTAADLADLVKLPFSEIEQSLDRLHRSGMLLEGSPGMYRRV